MRAVLADLGYANAKIQATTETVDGVDIPGFQMQTETLDPPQQIALKRALDSRFSINEDTYGLESVGATFGKQIIRNGIYAILLSFAVIIGYLTLRFEYKLAVPALISVIHDVWLSISVYSFIKRLDPLALRKPLSP